MVGGEYKWGGGWANILKFSRADKTYFVAPSVDYMHSLLIATHTVLALCGRTIDCVVH